MRSLISQDEVVGRARCLIATRSMSKTELIEFVRTHQAAIHDFNGEPKVPVCEFTEKLDELAAHVKGKSVIFVDGGLFTFEMLLGQVTNARWAHAANIAIISDRTQWTKEQQARILRERIAILLTTKPVCVIEDDERFTVLERAA